MWLLLVALINVAGILYQKTEAHVEHISREATNTDRTAMVAQLPDQTDLWETAADAQSGECPGGVQSDTAAAGDRGESYHRYVFRELELQF